MICSKIVNFDRTEAGLTSKCGRTLSTVQLCYIRTSLSAPYTDIQHRATSPKNYTETDRQRQGHRQEHNGLYSDAALTNKKKETKLNSISEETFYFCLSLSYSWYFEFALSLTDEISALLASNIIPYTRPCHPHTVLAVSTMARGTIYPVSEAYSRAIYPGEHSLIQEVSQPQPCPSTPCHAVHYLLLCHGLYGGQAGPHGVAAKQGSQVVSRASYIQETL